MAKITSRFQVGKSHLQNGELCQDRASHGTIGDVKYFAVADGIGSKKNSALGAEYLVNTFIRELAMNFDKLVNLDYDDMALKVQQVCLARFKSFHTSIGLPDYNSLKSTFSCVLIKNKVVLAINVGDSPIIIVNKNGSYIVMRYQGEFANSTTYLPSSSKWKPGEINIYRTENVDEIARIICCSDGVSDSLVADDNTVAKAVLENNFIDNLNEAMELFGQRSHDDCAIAIMENK